MAAYRTVKQKAAARANLVKARAARRGKFSRRRSAVKGWNTRAGISQAMASRGARAARKASWKRPRPRYPNARGPVRAGHSLSSRARATARAVTRATRGHALANRAYARSASASSLKAALRWQRRGMRHEARAIGRRTPRGRSRRGTWPSQANRSR